LHLKGRKALVTGGSRGIGEAISLTFAREGADVAVNYARNRDRALRVVEEIKSLGREAIAIQADVSVKSDVESMVEKVITQFGRIDILVNNAGIARGAPLLELSEEDWDAVLNTNLKGVFLCTQAVARHMVKNRYGRIINIASYAGLGAVPNTVDYSSSKAGVIALTKIAAYELGKYGIRVNSISPGMTYTDMARSSPEEEIEAKLSLSILKRFAKPEEIASVALFLASDESSMITAQNIRVDGGSYRHL
jgi:3-oxoacyl-[acyl-carrier protein] reductase